ncbi:MAG: hypothetical protein OEM23_00725 [Gemmatimonadota bacterium]|nr:hypothetical protein [Gemmatimonadota bacterium]MDH3426932.1 hypothetical protein [Gemmatimonadota bacterium]
MNDSHAAKSSSRNSKLAVFLIPFLVLAAPGCQPAEEAPAEELLTTLDSALSELGGAATTDLSRGQRWRMISSLGAGLPPSNFDPADLPEPLSRGAGLLTAYCVQCHAIPTPRMHAAAEWPILLRRMVLRAATLRDHMGGPLTRELVGEIRMSGFASSYLPSAADSDTLVSYLQRNALPVAQPGDLRGDPESELYRERCSICHETPSPSAHAAAEWGPVLARMQTYAGPMGIAPLDEADRDRIAAFLSVP